MATILFSFDFCHSAKTEKHRGKKMQALASFFACDQPLKTTHSVVFLTRSFESLLLSTEKQNGQTGVFVRFVGGSGGIRTHDTLRYT